MTHSLSESLGGGTPEAWARDWLMVAGFPASPENVRAVVSWELAESAGGGGMWNPLNTTQGGYPGETNANSVGVKNYASRSDGLAANAKVIHNGLYPQVVAAFDRGDSAQVVVDAIVRSPWGTRSIHLVPPSGPGPAPVPPKPKVRTMPMIMSNGHGGYWIVHSDGAVYAFGNANYFGGANTGALPKGGTIVDAAPTPTGKGYWLLSAVGAVYAYGDAKYLGGAPVA